MTPATSSSRYTRLAKVTAHAAGQPHTFTLALVVIIGCAVSGPLLPWTDTWQPVVNIGTAIITFLMVFLIQSTQIRDAEAVQVKLDELLRISPGAHNVLMNLEELEERELARIRAVYVKLAEEARR